jgi:hypothetical protein
MNKGIPVTAGRDARPRREARDAPVMHGGRVLQ